MITAITRLALISALVNSFNATLNCSQQLDEEKRRAQAIVELVQSVKSWPTLDIESLAAGIGARKEINELIRVAGRENAEIILRNKDSRNLIDVEPNK